MATTRELMERRILELEGNIGFLFGIYDENIRTIESNLSVAIRQCPEGVEIEGTQEKIEEAIPILEAVASQKEEISRLSSKEFARAFLGLLEEDGKLFFERMLKDVVAHTFSGDQIYARTVGQRKYVDAIKSKDVVFGIGPAGTGKTYLAVAIACTYLKKGLVNKLVITRPAVEAGEKLGFLPGDLKDKVDPYLRPIYDALDDILGSEQTLKLKERGTIEVAPLAYMRGRTLSKSFVILDEAQNTSKMQMKMLLTRMGQGSKVIVTGDVTQVDLPRGEESGLRHAEKVLANVKGIEFVKFSKKDVVRHQLVTAIIEAYENYETQGEKKND